tara:strand:- start:1212 stop:1778 length:567 start_codon:yes stop_codon:yes gene_type:complete
MIDINVKPQITFLSKELKKLDLEATNLDDKKTLLNLSKVVKKSKEFKNWSLPNAQIRYIGELLIALEFNVNKTIDTLNEINYFVEIKTFIDPELLTETTVEKKETKTNPEEVIKDKQSSQKKPLEERIIEYKIVKAAVTDGLEMEVKKMMSLGWIPYGGIGIDRAGMGGVALGQMTYFQAMVKLEELN